MTTAEKRARKKDNHRYGKKARAARMTRQLAHQARINASNARKTAELGEVDEFFGTPLPEDEAA